MGALHLLIGQPVLGSVLLNCAHVLAQTTAPLTVAGNQAAADDQGGLGRASAALITVEARLTQDPTSVLSRIISI